MLIEHSSRISAHYAILSRLLALRTILSAPFISSRNPRASVALILRIRPLNDPLAICIPESRYQQIYPDYFKQTAQTPNNPNFLPIPELPSIYLINNDITSIKSSFLHDFQPNTDTIHLNPAVTAGSTSESQAIPPSNLSHTSQSIPLLRADRWLSQTWVRHGDLELLFIKRSFNPRDLWSAQLAFPGGRRAKGETDYDTCIRETKEEVGLDLSNPRQFGFLGRLSDMHIDPIMGKSLMAVCSFVFLQLTPVTPPMYLESRELSQIIWTPLRLFGVGLAELFATPWQNNGVLSSDMINEHSNTNPSTNFEFENASNTNNNEFTNHQSEQQHNQHQQYQQQQQQHPNKNQAEQSVRFLPSQMSLSSGLPQIPPNVGVFSVTGTIISAPNRSFVHPENNILPQPPQHQLSHSSDVKSSVSQLITPSTIPTIANSNLPSDTTACSAGEMLLFANLPPKHPLIRLLREALLHSDALTNRKSADEITCQLRRLWVRAILRRALLRSRQQRISSSSSSSTSCQSRLSITIQSFVNDLVSGLAPWFGISCMAWLPWVNASTVSMYGNGKTALQSNQQEEASVGYFSQRKPLPVKSSSIYQRTPSIAPSSSSSLTSSSPTSSSSLPQGGNTTTCSPFPTFLVHSPSHLDPIYSESHIPPKPSHPAIVTGQEAVFLRYVNVPSLDGTMLQIECISSPDVALHMYPFRDSLVQVYSTDQSTIDKQPKLFSALQINTTSPSSTISSFLSAQASCPVLAVQQFNYASFTTRGRDVWLPFPTPSMTSIISSNDNMNTIRSSSLIQDSLTGKVLHSHSAQFSQISTQSQYGNCNNTFQPPKHALVGKPTGPGLTLSGKYYSILSPSSIAPDFGHKALSTSLSADTLMLSKSFVPPVSHCHDFRSSQRDLASEQQFQQIGQYDIISTQTVHLALSLDDKVSLQQKKTFQDIPVLPVSSSLSSINHSQIDNTIISSPSSPYPTLHMRATTSTTENQVQRDDDDVTPSQHPLSSWEPAAVQHSTTITPSPSPTQQQQQQQQQIQDSSQSAPAQTVSPEIDHNSQVNAPSRTSPQSTIPQQSSKSQIVQPTMSTSTSPPHQEKTSKKSTSHALLVSQPYTTNVGLLSRPIQCLRSSLLTALPIWFPTLLLPGVGLRCASRHFESSPHHSPPKDMSLFASKLETWQAAAQANQHPMFTTGTPETLLWGMTLRNTAGLCHALGAPVLQYYLDYDNDYRRWKLQLYSRIKQSIDQISGDAPPVNRKLTQTSTNGTMSGHNQITSQSQKENQLVHSALQATVDLQAKSFDGNGQNNTTSDSEIVSALITQRHLPYCNQNTDQNDQQNAHFRIPAKL